MYGVGQEADGRAVDAFRRFAEYLENLIETLHMCLGLTQMAEQLDPRDE